MAAEMIALKALAGLAAPLVKYALKKAGGLPAVKELRLTYALEGAIAEVWSSAGEYLVDAKVSESQQYLLALACKDELEPYANDVKKILSNSLDGEKIFEEIRSNHPWPQSVKDEKLETVYQMVFPIIASVLCNSAVVVNDIKEAEFSEILRRFDKVSSQLETVISGITKIQNAPESTADALFNKVLQQSLKKVLLGVEVTGLYGDKGLKQANEEMFILPEIVELIDEAKTQKSNSPKEKKRRDRQLNAKKVVSVEEHQSSFVGLGARTIVRGGPGSGKSTWSRWLQVECLRSSNKISVYIKLRSYSSGELPPIIDLIREMVGVNMGQEVTPEVLNKWIDSGQILIIFDGFDEMAPALREKALMEILDIGRYVKKSPMVLTSRPLNTDHIQRLSRWENYYISPFDEERVCDYIIKWYKYAPLKEGASRKVDANDLYSSLNQDPHIAPLTGNPLMLATLLMVHHNDGELPKGRSKLYARYIDGMLGIWDDQQEVQADVSGLNRENKKRVLTAIAISLHLREEDELDEDLTTEIVQQTINDYGYGCDPSSVLDSLRERSGLIVGPGSYGFSHKSIGEYLVARAICDGDQSNDGETLDRFRLSRSVGDDRWLNVIYFWAGLAPVADVQSFIEDVAPKVGAGIPLGILWDQMDRLKRDWVESQFKKIVIEFDNEEEHSDTEHYRSTYYSWCFDESEIPQLRQSNSPRTLPVHHVSAQGGGFAVHPFIGDLLVKVNWGKSDISWVTSEAVYSGLIGGLLDGQRKEGIPTNWFSSGVDRWPETLRLNLSAVYSIHNLLSGQSKDPVRDWCQAWDGVIDPKEGVLWVFSAVIIIWLHDEDRNSADRFFQALDPIIDLDWDDAVLKKTRKFYKLNTSISEGKKTEAVDLLETALEKTLIFSRFIPQKNDSYSTRIETLIARRSNLE